MHNVAPMTPTSTPGNTPNNTRHSSFVGDNESSLNSSRSPVTSPIASPVRANERIASTDAGATTTNNDQGSFPMTDIRDITATDDNTSSNSSSSSNGILNENVHTNGETSASNANENPENVNMNTNTNQNAVVNDNIDANSDRNGHVDTNSGTNTDTNTNTEARPTWAVRNNLDGFLAFFQYLFGILAFLLALRRLIMYLSPVPLWPEYPFNPEFLRLLEKLLFEDLSVSSSPSSSFPPGKGGSAEL